jgi:hypothetical protein
MKTYESLYKRHKQQEPQSAFAHFYAVQKDYDEPYKLVARQTMEGMMLGHFSRINSRTNIPTRLSLSSKTT